MTTYTVTLAMALDDGVRMTNVGRYDNNPEAMRAARKALADAVQVYGSDRVSVTVHAEVL